eukprot:31056-Pelagococcus_subviridis.AAC.5
MPHQPALSVTIGDRVFDAGPSAGTPPGAVTDHARGRSSEKRTRRAVRSEPTASRAREDPGGGTRSLRGGGCGDLARRIHSSPIRALLGEFRARRRPGEGGEERTR